MSDEIFNIDFRTGSFREKYSNAVGVNVGNQITKQSVGKVYSARQINSGQITYPASDMTALNFGTAPFSVVCAFKIYAYNGVGSVVNTIFSKGQYATSGSLGLQYGATNVLKWYWEDINEGIGSIVLNDFGSLNDGKYHLAILTFDGTTYKGYLDNIKETTESTNIKTISNSEDLYIGRDKAVTRRSNSDVAYIRAYDSVLTQQERNELYEEFLRSSPTEKEIKNIEYPKPTDLSNEEGLVAAYNMIPSAGGVLTDISGNGNNGTIHGALLTKEGVKFDGVKDYITLPNTNDLQLTGEASFAFRFKNLDGPNESAFISKRVADNNREYEIRYVPSVGVRYLDSNNVLSTNVILNSLENDLIIVRGIDYLKIFVNGIEVYNNSLSYSLSATHVDAYIGSRVANNVLAYQQKIEFINVKLYNYAFTPEQAKEYHNSFIKPTIIEDFSENSVGDTI